MTRERKDVAAAEALAEATFEELPDAPPRRRLKLTWVGKAAACVIAFWVLLAVTGPFIAPYHEAEFIEEDLHGNYYLDPSFLAPGEQV